MSDLQTIVPFADGDTLPRKECVKPRLHAVNWFGMLISTVHVPTGKPV